LGPAYTFVAIESMWVFLNPQTFEARWGDFYYKKKFSVSSAGGPPTGGVPVSTSAYKYCPKSENNCK